MQAGYLVAGSGLTGSAIARVLGDGGKDAAIGERRPATGVNVHDRLHASGSRVHTYGPHFFRTSSERLWAARWTSDSSTFDPEIQFARTRWKKTTSFTIWPQRRITVMFRDVDAHPISMGWEPVTIPHRGTVEADRQMRLSPKTPTEIGLED